MAHLFLSYICSFLDKFLWAPMTVTMRWVQDIIKKQRALEIYAVLKLLLNSNYFADGLHKNVFYKFTNSKTEATNFSTILQFL